MHRFGLASAVCLASFAAVADEWIVEARYTHEAQLSDLGARFQHAIIDREARTVTVEADETAINALRDAGFDVRVDLVASAQQRAIQPTGASLDSIPSFACYRTVEETAQRLDDLVLAYPSIAVADDLGPTWEREQDSARGYRMRALRITRLDTADGDPDRPRMVVFSSIHAREYAPAELMTRFAEWLITGYGNDAQATWLVDHVDFRFVLHANPDGRKKAEGGVLWRKNTDVSNNLCSGTPTGSYHAGIDLNRNFPFHWNTAPGGSSGAACDAVYRGPSAASEPETRNLLAYVAGTPAATAASAGAPCPIARTTTSRSLHPTTMPGCSSTCTASADSCCGRGAM